MSTPAAYMNTHGPIPEGRCCRWNHVRPCGPVPGNEDGGEPICACGCSGYDERCGGGEWWLPMESMEACLALGADIEAGRIYGFEGKTLDERFEQGGLT